MQRFHGKVVIVTGAGQGAGRAVCTLFAREGASVVVNDFDAGAAQSVAEETNRLGGAAVPDSGDVSTLDGAEGVVARAVETFGGLDILVNVRLLCCDLPLVETTAEDFDHVVRDTLKGAFMPTRAASVQFRQQRSGRVVTIASNAGLGDAGRTASAAASEGIVGMTRTAARDLGRYGVTCNAISNVRNVRKWTGHRRRPSCNTLPRLLDPRQWHRIRRRRWRRLDVLQPLNRAQLSQVGAVYDGRDGQPLPDPIRVAQWINARQLNDLLPPPQLSCLRR